MAGRRRLFLFGLLALTVLAALWVSDMPDTSDAVVASATEKAIVPRKENKSAALAEHQVTLALDKLQRDPMEVGELNPFGVKSWFVPPPAPPAKPAAAPPAPTVPPLPFTYVGKLEQDAGRWVIYLAKGEEAYSVSKGETFDNVYRFDGIENGNLVIQYLPLAVKQLLPIGAEN